MEWTIGKWRIDTTQTTNDRITGNNVRAINISRAPGG